MGQPWVLACAALLVASVALRLVPAQQFDDDDLMPEELGYLRAGRRRVRLLARARRQLGLPIAPFNTRTLLVYRGLVAPSRRRALAVALALFAAGLAALSYLDPATGATATPAIAVGAATLLTLLGPRRTIVAGLALRNARARFEQRLRGDPATATAELALLMVAFEGRPALDAILAQSTLARAVPARPIRVPARRPAPVPVRRPAPVPVRWSPAPAPSLRPAVGSRPGDPRPALLPAPASLPMRGPAPATFVPALAPAVAQLEWHTLVPRAWPRPPALVPPPPAPVSRRRITFLGVGRVPSVALRHQGASAPRPVGPVGEQIGQTARSNAAV